MQKIIYRSDIDKYQNEIDQSVISHIEEGLIETFEDFGNYILAAFDWYNIYDSDQDPSQLIVYFDAEDIFVICENEDSFNAAQKCFTETDINEKTMYLFFKNLFKGDTKNLERLEDEISVMDDDIIAGTGGDIREKIVSIRYELLRLKKYYDQFSLIFDELCDNDNNLISDQYVYYFEVLKNRTAKMASMVLNLREFIVQVRESYQAQIDIEQNRIMKIFTLVTSIFLPLTLVAGWYGMNLKMPEYKSEIAYPILIAICVIVCVVWFLFFRKKGWFK